MQYSCKIKLWTLVLISKKNKEIYKKIQKKNPKMNMKILLEEHSKKKYIFEYKELQLMDEESLSIDSIKEIVYEDY